jgi:methyl-accepting chemotaxis protein
MDKLSLFVLLTGLSILLQAGILAAMFFTMRKSAEKMEALAGEIKTRVLPTVELAQSIMTEMQPRLQVIAENLEETSTTVRSQIERVDATVTDVVDRARLQVIRGDELLTRTLDRVEQTSDLVHKTVVSPVRQVSGLMQGLTVGLEFLFSGRGRRNGGRREERRPVPQDEMFI